MRSAAIDDHEQRAAAGRRWPRGTLPAVAIAVAATVGAAAAIARWPLDDTALVWRSVPAALVGGGLVWWFAARHLAAASFGAANVVTLGRGALTMLLVALLASPPTAALGWLAVALGTLAVTLDGVDGRLARRRGETSAFGARFDMETDALLILVLAAFVWRLDKAGAWILAAGLLRYLFVAASYAWSWLGAALPPSRRRQTVCVLQIVSLLAALLPFVLPPWSVGVAFAGLALLVASFAVDVVWLRRHVAV